MKKILIFQWDGKIRTNRNPIWYHVEGEIGLKKSLESVLILLIYSVRNCVLIVLIYSVLKCVCSLKCVFNLGTKCKNTFTTLCLENVSGIATLFKHIQNTLKCC